VVIEVNTLEDTTELEKYGKKPKEHFPMNQRTRKYVGKGDSGEILEKRKEYFSDPNHRGGKLTTLNEDLINEICDYMKLGATNIVVCRVIGVHQETFLRWLQQGKDYMMDGADIDPIYGLLYTKYEEARGRRVLSWLEKVKDPKWLLQRHPDTKNDFAELRYQKNDLDARLSPGEASARQVEAEKRIGVAIGNIRGQTGNRRLSDDKDNGEVSEEPGTPDGESSVE